MIYYYFDILYKIKYILTEFNCNNSIISRFETITYTCINTCRAEMRSSPKRMWIWLVISNPFLNLRIPIGWECQAEQTKFSGSVTERRNCFLCSCMGLFIFVHIYNWKYTICNSSVDGTKGKISVANDFMYNVRL